MKTAKIYLYGVIGYDWWEGTDNRAKRFAKDFNDALKDDEVKEIHIHINSVGGNVHEGLAIFTTIQQSTKPTVAIIDGIAFSMGAIISLAANTSKIAKNGLFMLHNVSGWAGGNAKQLRKTAQTMDTYDTALAQSIADKTGETVEEVKSLWMDFEDHFIGAQESVDFKLVDEILPTEVELDAMFEGDNYGDIMDSYQNRPMKKAETPEGEKAPKNLVQKVVEKVAETITPKKPKTNKKSDMTINAKHVALVGLLALSVEDDKDVELTAEQLDNLESLVAGLQAKVTTGENDVTNLTSAKQTLDNKVTELNTANETLTSEKTALENKVTTLEAKVTELGKEPGGSATAPTGGTDHDASNTADDDFKCELD